MGKKNKEVREGLLFSEWASKMFPGLDTKNDVPAALWFAENFLTVRKNIPAELTHPKGIRQWFRDAQPAAPECSGGG